MSLPRITPPRAIAALLGVAAAMVLSLGPAAATGSGTVPFTDPEQRGLLTLCSQAGQPVTSGSVDAIPFVWKAISSSPAPSGYRSHGLATLYAYQPIQYVDPGDWSGKQMSGASVFSNPDHPAIASTKIDEPFVAFTGGYPLHWQGLAQLRMIYTAPNNEPNPGGYPTAVIRVTGNTWTMVQGGDTPCNAGKATSTESIVLGSKTTSGKGRASDAAVGPSATATAPSSRPSGGTSKGSAAPSAQAADPATSNAASTASTVSASSGLGSGAKAAIGLGVLAVLVLGWTVFARRRQAGS